MLTNSLTLLARGLQNMATERKIQDDVISALRAEPYLESEHIGVSVENNIVSLSGRVRGSKEHKRAVLLANEVTGVKAVENNLRVGWDAPNVNKDPEILFAVLEALKWHSAAEQGLITASVANGIVTLSGLVDWDYQRTHIGKMISMLKGVEQLNNQIKVRRSIA